MQNAESIYQETAHQKRSRVCIAQRAAAEQVEYMEDAQGSLLIGKCGKGKSLSAQFSAFVCTHVLFRAKGYSPPGRYSRTFKR